MFALAFGGTAVGTVLNTHPAFGNLVAAELAHKRVSFELHCVRVIEPNREGLDQGCPQHAHAVPRTDRRQMTTSASQLWQLPAIGNGHHGLLVKSRLFRCRAIMNCTEVCPKGLAPSRVIQKNRLLMVKDAV